MILNEVFIYILKGLINILFKIRLDLIDYDRKSTSTAYLLKCSLSSWKYIHSPYFTCTFSFWAITLGRKIVDIYTGLSLLKTRFQAMGLGWWPGHLPTTWGWFWVHVHNTAHVRPQSKKWIKKRKLKVMIQGLAFYTIRFISTYW